METKKTIYLIMAVLLIIIFTIAFFFKDKFFKKPPVANTPSVVMTKVTYEDALEKKNQNSLTTIASSSFISLSKIDPDLSFLVTTNDKKVAVKSVNYTDNTTGYVINFENSIVSAQFYIDLLNVNKYNILFGSKTSNSSYLLAKNQTYKIEININTGKIEIKIQKNEL